MHFGWHIELFSNRQGNLCLCRIIKNNNKRPCVLIHDGVHMIRWQVIVYIGYSIQYQYWLYITCHSLSSTSLTMSGAYSKDRPYSNGPSSRLCFPRLILQPIYSSTVALSLCCHFISMGILRYKAFVMHNWIIVFFHRFCSFCFKSLDLYIIPVLRLPFRNTIPYPWTKIVRLKFFQDVTLECFLMAINLPKSS